MGKFGTLLKKISLTKESPSKKFTGIDPNAKEATTTGTPGRRIDQIPGLRIPLGTPSTPLGPGRPNPRRRKY